MLRRENTRLSQYSRGISAFTTQCSQLVCWQRCCCCRCRWYRVLLIDALLHIIRILTAVHAFISAVIFISPLMLLWRNSHSYLQICITMEIFTFCFVMQLLKMLLYKDKFQYTVGFFILIEWVPHQAVHRLGITLDQQLSVWLLTCLLALTVARYPTIHPKLLGCSNT